MHESDKNRYRNFMAIFYDESIHYKFNDVIFNLHGFKYWAYIKHESDEEEKQVHYHCFVTVDNAKSEEAFAKCLGVPVHKVQHVKNIRSSCRYLTHIDYPEKIQYSLDEVKISGLFRRKFLKHFEDVKTEEEILQDMYNWIDIWNFDSYHEKLKMFVQYVNMQCYDTIYKRYRFELQDYLKASI